MCNIGYISYKNMFFHTNSFHDMYNTKPFQYGLNQLFDKISKINVYCHTSTFMLTVAFTQHKLHITMEIHTSKRLISLDSTWEKLSPAPQNIFWIKYSDDNSTHLVHVQIQN
jgi:hypothetical protein